MLLLDLLLAGLFWMLGTAAEKGFVALDTRPRRALDLHVSRAAYPRALRVFCDSRDRVRSVVVSEAPERRPADARSART